MSTRLLLIFLILLPFRLTAQSPDDIELHPAIKAAENERVEIVKAASETVVCVLSTDGQGGGSGVIVESSGYVVTNFHVADPCGRHMHCGLNDGKVYDAVVVGIDPVGDLALIKMFGRQDFPVARFADSDQVRVGQACFAAGNPFLLANDFSPSISWGIVSGKNRYQYPSGTLLEYADCIQTDAAINPGNSGGPLFDANGLLIGINGRGSFEKRGRVNVGVGYAISSNQVRNFLGSLKSGRILDHATAGFVVASSGGQTVRVSKISNESHAYRLGIRYDAEILNLAGRKINSANDVKNILGTIPTHWCVPITFRQNGETRTLMLRLRESHSPEDLLAKVTATQQSTTGKKHKTPDFVAQSFVARRGFSNYFFNRSETERVLNSVKRTYNPDSLVNPQVNWTGRSKLDEVSFVMNGARSGIKIGNETGTLQGNLPFENQNVPPRSGGFLNTLHIYHELLFSDTEKLGVSYLGTAPFIPPASPDISTLWRSKKLYDVLKVLRDGTVSLIYIDSKSNIRAIEYFPFPESDPCVSVFQGQIKSQSSNSLSPLRIQASLRNRSFVDFEITRSELGIRQNPKEVEK